MDSLVSLFVSIGLTEQKAEDTIKNKKLAPLLESVLKDANVDNTGCSKEMGVALYTLASTITKDALPHRTFLATKIKKGDLKSSVQIAAAIKFAEDCDGGHIDEKAFDEAAGVGVTVMPEQVKIFVSQYIEENKVKIVSERYKTLGPTLSNLRKHYQLRWAEGSEVKSEVEAQFLALLGPKDERDAPQKKKAKEPKPQPKAEIKEKEEEPVDIANMFFEGAVSKLHKPGENKQIKPELMEQHLKATGGKVYTRFPPEPNGFLHIGHAKAINVDFGYAKAYNGVCYLRYDDTNPEAEEDVYFESIIETVRWLGFEPWKVTYSSDYFQELYELAVKLIKKGLAYTCQCTGEEIHAHRGGDNGGARSACVHRDRSIEETLDQFQKMKEGRYKEGEVTLRMKMDLENGNPQFWDLIAYRILYTPHIRTGSTWCIYPTYDFTHCLVDSMENITHSLCTTEFRQSRESYYWLVDAVEIYKPVQWEFGRLSVAGTITSKRKILKLVNEKHVSGWDDPRLYTLIGIRRRGVPPEAVNNFVLELGVSVSKSTIEVSRFDMKTREYLDRVVPRVMAILNPLKVVIKNLPDDHLEDIVIPNKPRDPSMGDHTVPFTKVIYIDASDFREQDSKDYYRLAPGKTVGLLHVKHPIRYVDCKKNEAGEIEELVCEYLNESEFKKPKTYIHWVAESAERHSPVKIDEVRLYNPLFKHRNPTDAEGGFLNDLNADSLVTVKGAIASVGLYDQIAEWAKETGAKDKESMRWQFTRTGFFCLDWDTELDQAKAVAGDVRGALGRIVINRTVTLKEDSGKS